MANGDDISNGAEDALSFSREILKSGIQNTENLKQSVSFQRELVNLMADEKDILDQISEGSMSLSDAKEKQAESQNILNNLQELRAEELAKEGEGNQLVVELLSEQIDRAKQLNEALKSGVGEIEGGSKGANKLSDILQGAAGSISKNFKIPKGGIEAFTKGVRKSSMAGASFSKSMGGGIKALSKFARVNPFALILTAVVSLVKALLAANNRITALAKGLGVSKDEARDLNTRLNRVSVASNNILNTSTQIKQAFADINTFLGTSSTILSSDLLDGVATLQNRLGLTKEAAMGFAQASLLGGKSVDNIKKDALVAAAAVEAELGTRMDLKGVLEESGKITGVIRSQLGGSIEAIAEAVTKAKQFGITLKEVASAGRELLNFEQSISAELEAELLTGKQLNLEQARLAALTGDYKTLTSEIMKNVGSIHEFNSMNVLQQEALAKSVGMEANQLADVLMKRQNLEQLAQEARAAGREDLARQYEQLSTQQKFNAAIEKLKDFLVIIVEQLEAGKGLFGAFRGASREFKRQKENADAEENQRVNRRGANDNPPIDYDKLAKAMSNVNLKPVVKSNPHDLYEPNNYNGFNQGQIRYNNQQT